MSDSQRVLEAVRRLVRQLRIGDRAAQQGIGVSAAQLFVLSQVGRTPKISLGELAERTHTDQSSASAVVARLVEKGLLSRERAADDARRLVLTLTSAGRAALRKAPSVAQEEILAAVDKLSPRERKQFADTFNAILDAIGAEKCAPLLFEEEEPRTAPRRKKKSE
jgi:DNA-binding MarR family transcriptional regulator